MLASFSKHSLIDLASGEGRLEVDAHHTVEDVAHRAGQALREALGDKAGIRRFGDALVPARRGAVQAAVDVSGRPYFVHSGEPEGQEYVVVGGTYVGSLTRHVFETLALTAGIAVACAGARRPRPAPPRGGAVQGARPRPARRRRARPASSPASEHQGQPGPRPPAAIKGNRGSEENLGIKENLGITRPAGA